MARRQDLRLAVAAAVMLACGSTPTAPPTGANTDTLAAAHFTFHYTPAYAGSIAALAVLVELQSGRIVSDLVVSLDMPRVHVYFHDTHAELSAAVASRVGPVPSWATGVVTSAEEIHLISPTANVAVSRAAVDVLHEFAHCVTLRYSSSSAKNPRWLWETIAIYESGQFVDPRTVPSLSGGQVPSLSALNSDSSTEIYSVGFVLGEFIVDRGGLEALRALMTTHGNTAGVLGLDEAGFATEWAAFLHRRYGI